MKVKHLTESVQVQQNTIAHIAKTILNLDTLVTQRSSDDFKEQAVWGIKQALEAAYTAGFNAAKESNKP